MEELRKLLGQEVVIHWGQDNSTAGTLYDLTPDAVTLRRRDDGDLIILAQAVQGAEAYTG